VRNIQFFLIYFIFSATISFAETPHQKAVTQSISTKEIVDYEKYSPVIKELISTAISLSSQHLTYTYGSAHPKNGGMDCSGTINYLLQTKLKEVPRASDQLYLWAIEKGKFHPVKSNHFESAEFSHLKPGDLLFWSGTYPIKRDVPITHVMIYIGKNQQNQPLMFGASNGRTYQGKKMWGVSIFDFQLPNAESKSRFVGYSCIPNLTCHDL
jgi:cell wall-associated NlpC family hydrolase